MQVADAALGAPADPLVVKLGHEERLASGRMRPMAAVAVGRLHDLEVDAIRARVARHQRPTEHSPSESRRHRAVLDSRAAEPRTAPNVLSSATVPPQSSFDERSSTLSGHPDASRASSSAAPPTRSRLSARRSSTREAAAGGEGADDAPRRALGHAALRELERLQRRVVAEHLRQQRSVPIADAAPRQRERGRAARPVDDVQLGRRKRQRAQPAARATARRAGWVRLGGGGGVIVSASDSPAASRCSTHRSDAAASSTA